MKFAIRNKDGKYLRRNVNASYDGRNREMVDDVNHASLWDAPGPAKAATLVAIRERDISGNTEFEVVPVRLVADDTPLQKFVVKAGKTVLL